LTFHPSMALVTSYQTDLTVSTLTTLPSWSLTPICSISIISNVAKSHRTLRAPKIWNLEIKVSKNLCLITTSSTILSLSTKKWFCSSISRATWMATPNSSRLTLRLKSKMPQSAQKVTGHSATLRSGKEQAKLFWLVTAIKSSRWFSKTRQNWSYAVEMAR